MKQFRITFRQEVIVEAKTKEEAEEIFSDLDLDDLDNEWKKGIIEDSIFIEKVSIEEQLNK